MLLSIGILEGADERMFGEISECGRNMAHYIS